MAAATLGMISCDSEDSSCIKSTCEGSVLNVCRDGQIVEHKTCPNGCSDSQCIANAADAYEGQIKCEGNTPVRYTGGNWIPQTPCANYQRCLSGVCHNVADPENVCTGDQMRCSKYGVPQKCLQEIWTDQTPCAAGYECMSGKCEPKAIQKCTEGKAICDNKGIPTKCIDGAWVEQATCTNNTTCKDGQCVEPPKCWNKQCAVDETCMNNVCVPNWQFDTPDGTKCNTETWVEYCNNENEAVSCASSKGVYRIKCSTSCVVVDLTIANNNEPWYPAFCDTDKSQYCTEKDIYLESYYCYSQTELNNKTYYESSYQCAPKFGGGYFALDYLAYFDPKNCPEGCDSDNEHCAECVDKCNGNILNYCTETERKQIDCAGELDAVCKSFSSAHKADCFDTSDECEKLNETRTRCDLTGGKGSVTTWTCLHADNDQTAKNYWVKTATKACPAACNAEKTDCSK